MTPISRLTLRLQSDSRLVELAASGREPAFATIVERYRSPLLRYCARLLPFDRAEDVVQQTFENALTALRGDDRPRQLRPWLYRIAHNLAINTLRKNGWDYDQLDPNYDGVSQPPDIVGQRHRLEGLVQRIRELPDRQRSALVLREFEGRSYEEIARELDATPPIVRQLLHRARTRLRDGVGLLVPLPKVGVSLFAAATIAGGAGVAVQHGGDHHRIIRDTRPKATQALPQAASPTRRTVLASEPSVSNRNPGAQRRDSNENDGGHTVDRRDSTTGRDHDHGGDEEKGDRQGRPDDDEEQGTESRVSGKEDDEPEESEDHSGGDSGGSESSESGGHEGEGSDSAPSTPEEPAAPPA